MPLKLPEFGYRTTAPARGRTHEVFAWYMAKSRPSLDPFQHGLDAGAPGDRVAQIPA
jgi:hypothetical protein